MDKLIAEARALCTASDVDGNVMADTMARLVAALEAAEARAARVAEALGPFARYACDPPDSCAADGRCSNCVAKTALAGGRDGR